VQAVGHEHELAGLELTRLDRAQEDRELVTAQARDRIVLAEEA